MQTSFEAFLLINFSLDLILLTIVSRHSGNFHPGRTCLGALMLSAYGILTVIRPDPWQMPLLQIIIIIPVSMLVIGTSDIRLWGPVAGLMAIGLVLSAGSIHLISETNTGRIPVLVSTLIGLFLMGLLLFFRKRMRNSWICDLRISVNGATSQFRALIDTGNRLHEPLSGLPVIIAERQLIMDVLPDEGYRSVAYGGLGGNGVMKCFRPDFIWISFGRKYRRAPDAYVAISPDGLPGVNRALAPVEFASL